MECKRSGSTVIVRLDIGEKICESLLAVAAREKIRVGAVSGLAAVNDAVIGVFVPETKEFDARHLTGDMEVSSLVGNLTECGGAPYAHLHITLGDRQGRVFAGHLKEATVSVTGELFITVLDTVVEREMHPVGIYTMVL